MNATGRKKREVYLDVSKFVAIFLVVIRHVRDYAGDATVWTGMGWLENLGQVTSVAIFFVVSGYLSRSLMSSGDVAKLVRRQVTYLWPASAAVWIGFALVQLVLMGTCSAPPNGWIRLSFSVGWFFWCLVLCETMTFAAFFACRQRKKLLALALAGGFAVVWSLPVGLFHAAEMLPAYWAGLFVLPHLLASRWALPIGVGLLVTHLLVVFACGDFATCGLSHQVETSHLIGLTPRGFLLQTARWLVSLAGGIGGVLVIRAVTARWPRLDCLAPLGAQTLGVFFIHVFLLILYYGTVGWTGGGLFGRMAIAVATFAVAYALTVLSRRNPVCRAILWNPLELLRRRENSQ